MLFKSLLLGASLAFSAAAVAGQDEFNLETQLKRAQAGDATSMARVGELYSFGLYNKEKEKKARYWLNKAIAAGSSEGLFQMGKLHERGQGYKIDKNKALDYYRQASNKDHTEAMYLYAIALNSGDVIEKNTKKAQKLIAKCAKLGGDSCKLYQQMMKNFNR